MQYFLFCKLILYLATSLYLDIQIVSNLLLLPASRHSDEDEHTATTCEHVTHTRLPAILLKAKTPDTDMSGVIPITKYSKTNKQS